MITSNYKFLPKNLTVFFANEGLSMSEANHTANMINQINVAINARINNSNAVEEVVTFEGKEIVITKAEKEEQLSDLCKKEGTLYGLSAWLRESIKAKDALFTRIKNAGPAEFMVEEGDVVPEFEMEAPKMPRSMRAVQITEDDVLATFTIAERAEYFKLEAEAAHVGKKIHSTGKIDSMRNSVLHFTSFRMQAFQEGQGNKDYPVARKTVYTQPEIDKVYFDLQSHHRTVESKLNWYKARIKNEINMMQVNENKKHTLAVELANADYDKAATEYNKNRSVYINSLQKMQAVAEERRVQLTNEVSKFKVAVPNCFVESLKYVQEYNG